MENKDIDIKEKVKRIASTIEQNDNDNGFNYFEEMMNGIFVDDSDLPIIKEKMDNLIKLFEKINAEGEEEFEKFMDLDFEDDIWNLI